MALTQEAWNAALAERHGSALQEKFQAASVCICGLGGLGSNIAILLARAGVEHLHLIDFDAVDVSNLNRQQYFPDQLGMEKTAALTETLRRIAPYSRFTSETVRLTPENIPTLLRGFPIICEAFDKADQKAMLVNAVLESFPEAYLIAASGMAGIGSPNTIRTRRITKRFYLCGDETSDIADGIGLFSARVAVCAAHQATTVLRILAEAFEP